MLFELQRAVLANASVILDRASLRPIQNVLRGALGPVAARLANRRMFLAALPGYLPRDIRFGQEWREGIAGAVGISGCGWCFRVGWMRDE